MSQEKSAQELYAEWENANAELAELREQYGMVTRTLRLGEHIQRPQRTATPKARTNARQVRAGGRSPDTKPLHPPLGYRDG